MTILQVNNLQVAFQRGGEEDLALKGISFSLKRGEILGIVGESGSGKSVTALAIMGLLPPDAKATGEILFFDSGENPPLDLLSLPSRKRREINGGKIAIIFQEPMSSLNPVYNIGFQIVEAIVFHQAVSLKEAKRRAISLLQEVQLLPSDEELAAEFLSQSHKTTPTPPQIQKYINQRKRAILAKYPHEMSGGQLQRVMIAMAIACHPQILIADEPTTALDVTVQATILSLLKELCRRRQMSLVFITHDLAVVANMADSLAVMRRGKIVEYGNSREILSHPSHPYTKGLLACRPRLHETRVYLPTVDDFLGNSNNLSFNPTTTVKPKDVKLAQPLLVVENLRVGYRKKHTPFWQKEYFWAVDGVSFQLFPGETLGLVGESGCGKSTLARSILRLIPSVEGKIEFLGVDLTAIPPASKTCRRLRQQMQIIFQNPYNSLNPRMTIGDIILEPMTIHRVGGNSQKRKERVRYLLERVGLNPDWYHRYPHQLSGGERQRVCIAKALALNPQLIICDECVSALDVSIQAQVLNLLKQLQAEFGLTYIFISHDLSVVKFLSDRIMVMNKGRIEEISTADQIVNNPQTQYTRQLIASIPQFPEAA